MPATLVTTEVESCATSTVSLILNTRYPAGAQQQEKGSTSCQHIAIEEAAQRVQAARSPRP